MPHHQQIVNFRGGKPVGSVAGVFYGVQLLRSLQRYFFSPPSFIGDSFLFWLYPMVKKTHCSEGGVDKDSNQVKSFWIA